MFCRPIKVTFLFLVIAGTVLVVRILAMQSIGNREISAPEFTPSIAVQAQATTVTVMAEVPLDPALIKTSVTLVRRYVSGKVTVLAPMYDDGTHGDRVSGDGNYTAQIVVNEVDQGPVDLFVTAAYHDQVRRVSSPVASLFVTGVQWKVLSVQSLGVSIKYPGTYIPNSDADPTVQEVGFSENQDAANAGLPPAFVLSFDPLPTSESLRDWIHSFGVTDDQITEVAIAERTYLRWSETGGEGNGEAVSYSVTAPNNRVLTITVYSSSLASSPTLNSILSSLSFPTP